MDKTCVSCSVVCAKFLGSKDDILVYGDVPHATLQVLRSHHFSKVNGRESLIKITDLDLQERAETLDICGMPRLGKTFAAVSQTNRKTGQGLVSLIDIKTSVDDAVLTFDGNLADDDLRVITAYSSLAYHLDSETLAGGTDAGDVIIWDLHRATEIYRIRADPSGISKVKYLSTGQLLTLGNSLGDQIKVWDLRVDTNRQLSSTISPVNANTRPSNRKPSMYCNVLGHPVQDKILASTASGTVEVTDMRYGRSSSTLEFRPHTSAGMTQCTRVFLSIMLCSHRPFFSHYFSFPNHIVALALHVNLFFLFFSNVAIRL